MSTGEVGILNVGAGDMKLTFDKTNASETIRAGRIVKDMIRRGYALLVEVEREGVKAYERAKDFDERTNEYIIADFDPIEAMQTRKREKEEREREQWVKDHQAVDQAIGAGEHGEKPAGEAAKSETPGEAEAGSTVPAKGRRGSYQKRVAAGTARAVAVGRSAGG